MNNGVFRTNPRPWMAGPNPSGPGRPVAVPRYSGTSLLLSSRPPSHNTSPATIPPPSKGTAAPESCAGVPERARSRPIVLIDPHPVRLAPPYTSFLPSSLFARRIQHDRIGRNHPGR